MRKQIQRELEVAFSKQAQPVWFRVVKYVIVIGTLYLFWDSKWFWLGLAVVAVVSLLVHFWYRHKTEGWSKSYGLWKYEKNRPSEPQNKSDVKRK